MVDMAAWLGTGTPIGESERAALAWRRISQKPTQVSFRTPAGVTLAAQTVRLEYDTAATIESSAAGNAPRMPLIVFGVRNYGSITTDMAEGYRFVHNGDEYQVRDVIETIGERQAIAVARG